MLSSFDLCKVSTITSKQLSIKCFSKGLFIREKLSRLGREIVPTRSRHNANFRSSIHMSQKFPRLTVISPTADQDLGLAQKYFLI